MTRAGVFSVADTTHAAPPPPPPSGHGRRGRLPARSPRASGESPLLRSRRLGAAIVHGPGDSRPHSGPRQPPPPDVLSGGRPGEPGGRPRRDPRVPGQGQRFVLSDSGNRMQPLSRPRAQHDGHHHSESSWDSPRVVTGGQRGPHLRQAARHGERNGADFCGLPTPSPRLPSSVIEAGTNLPRAERRGSPSAGGNVTTTLAWLCTSNVPQVVTISMPPVLWTPDKQTRSLEEAGPDLAPRA